MVSRLKRSCSIDSNTDALSLVHCRLQALRHSSWHRSCTSELSPPAKNANQRPLDAPALLSDTLSSSRQWCFVHAPWQLLLVPRPRLMFFPAEQDKNPSCIGMWYTHVSSRVRLRDYVGWGGLDERFEVGGMLCLEDCKVSRFVRVAPHHADIDLVYPARTRRRIFGWTPPATIPTLPNPPSTRIPRVSFTRPCTRFLAPLQSTRNVPLGTFSHLCQDATRPTTAPRPS